MSKNKGSPSNSLVRTLTTLRFVRTAQLCRGGQVLQSCLFQVETMPAGPAGLAPMSASLGEG